MGRAIVTWSKIWRTGLLWAGWNVVLCQKLLHCELGVMCIVMVQDPTLLPISWPFPPDCTPQLLQNINIKRTGCLLDVQTELLRQALMTCFHSTDSVQSTSVNSIPFTLTGSAVFPV
jgi:hypothetical protein